MSCSKEIILDFLYEERTIKQLKEIVPERVSYESINAGIRFFVKNNFASRKLIKTSGCTQIYSYKITELGIRWLFRPKQYIVIKEEGD